ncbi:DUF885 domain-containing protein [Anthocerotibacter panamensis]|uniref:DUF885 domain-containing protein n=1 Tax=Anthocerotibacter panamensis TaxID=2857077 RepID=UPI001C40854C|nr:DUF885 domain-containing protein [Anthocerotibacter panamensis]
MRYCSRSTLSVALLLSALIVPRVILAQGTQPAPAVKTWVTRSNENAQVLLGIQAKFSPEGAGRLGISGLDEQILDLQPDTNERLRVALSKAETELKSRLAKETDPPVRQDLEILLQATQNNQRGNQLAEKYEVPYLNATRLVFGGVRGLLDDQVPPERRKAALVRLKRYAGLEAGYTPITLQAEARIREKLGKSGLLPPIKSEVERDLATTTFFIDGIGQLFAKYQIVGYEEPYTKLKAQLQAYNDFLRQEVLPKARTDFREPPEEYAFSLEQLGVDIPPEQLARQAHAAFDQIQKEMQTLASRIAQEKGLSVTDYREVIRTLKKDQLVGEAILPHYQQRLAQIEDIIRREHLVTLPTRAARIRLASPAESAATPAPNMRPPRLIGNTGELGEFVLPLNVPTNGAETQKPDDYTYAAASWTLTAHEARPGHELQFASLIENGVSTARGVFSFNSTNVEGWGLYSEHILQPYMPAEGRLVSLQLQLLRAARAFLDPELQAGKTTPAAALSFLQKEVVVSLPFATQEVERYTFTAPGQATSYFYGYTRLLALRTETEHLLGKNFDQQKFHDFILAQGLLPPALLRKAVLEGFVKGKSTQ